MQQTTGNPACDESWRSALAAGEESAVGALRARLRAGLGRALAGRGDVDEADLDDFTQDGVLRVLARLDSFRGDSALLTWAMAIAIRVAFTALRRRRVSAPLDDGRRAPTGGDGPGHAGRRELFAALRGAIATVLSPRQRHVLLSELAGVPQVVLAERLGARPGAVYKMSHDARRRLKAALEEAGFDAETVRATLTESSQ